ncbi:unnamed protein product [Auanema sp. JU1783]|nr:unnamed protein product [Auanema sp. JU1783]
MVSISFRVPAAHAMTMIPMSNYSVNQDRNYVSRRRHNAIVDFFFGHSSWHSIIFYVLIAILSLGYNFAVFYLNFGEAEYVDGLFSEVTLLRLISCQWLLSFFLATLAILYFHEVCLPVYVFLSILTTNGSAVLFVINARKVYDNVMVVDSQYFMILCFIFGASIAHCAIYIYALHLQEQDDRVVHENQQHYFWNFLQFRRVQVPLTDEFEKKHKTIYSIV